MPRLVCALASQILTLRTRRGSSRIAITGSHSFGSLIKAYGSSQDIYGVEQCWKDMRSRPEQFLTRRKFLVGGRPGQPPEQSGSGHTCLGRCLVTRRNFPDVWYKSKKLRTHLSSYVCACFLMCCSRLTFPGRTGVLVHGGWAGLNAPEDSVWKSPQVMTHLVEQACWMEEA